MSKAEEKGYEAYPYNGDYRGQGDSNSKYREVYIEGYHQAEKDLELTWEDMRDIIETYHKFTQKNLWAQHKTLADGYQEILKRFKDFKERKEK